jgi:regulator of protease activity HflC (stomatin/prohibitin superfamily)
LTLIEDQIQRGVYRTETIQDKKPDPMTGQLKTVNIVKIMFDQNTKLPLRAEPSPLQDFGIKTFNLSINEINYDPEVEKQIQQQQKALMQVQIAAAQAKEAEQNAITVGKRGEADAAKAKWEQEVIKAKAVTEGEQKLRVAELAAREAEQYKRAEILKGEGEATRRKLVMEADNALEIKIGAYERVMSQWAEAASKYQGNWVPVYQFGGGGSQQPGVNALLDLLTVKTARDLGLDMTMPKPKKEK